MENSKPKPPTQGVGVAGFKADAYASDQVKLQWQDLIHSPKYQMFALEHSQGKYGDVGNVMEWITGYVQDQVQSKGERNFFNMYVKWHDEKGYWKNEDVYGNLI